MSMLGEELEGARVLDLFAGIGGLGMEALSRGAHDCTLVESDAGVARRLRGAFGVDARVVCGDACDPARLGLTGCYSVVFLDPPWGQGLGVVALEALSAAGVASEDAVAVVITEAGSPADASGWEVRRRRRHGDGEVTLWSKRERQEGAPRGSGNERKRLGG
jgi:16S rRNA (guanine966-N2)-methyltransferase